jgi:hypothetical protein
MEMFWIIGIPSLIFSGLLYHSFLKLTSKLHKAMYFVLAAILAFGGLVALYAVLTTLAGADTPSIETLWLIFPILYFLIIGFVLNYLEKDKR